MKLKSAIRKNKDKSKQPKVHLKTHKVKNGKVKKTKALVMNPPQKFSLTLKKDKKRSLVLAPSPEHDGDDTSAVAQYVASKEVRNPLDDMLKDCSFETCQSSTSMQAFTPTVAEYECSVNKIDYTIPLTQEYDFEEDVSEAGSSDLGSLIETSEEEEEEVFIKKKVGEYRRYEAINGVVILLAANSKLFVHGVMSVKVLFGTVNILGKELNKTNSPSMVYSPKGSAFLSVENANVIEDATGATRESIENQLIKLGVDSFTCNDIAMFKLKKTTAVMHCVHAADKATDFLEANFAQTIYPKFEDGLRCAFKNVTSEEWNVVNVSPEWEQLVNLLHDEANSTKLVLCGGKGVGKSTLLRYLVNKMLNTRKHVYVLDLDPGQPEFTVPGAVSIVKVTSGLLGPNYTHLQDAERTVFVPNVNILANHNGYLESVRALIEYLPSNEPVVVNYMGFTRGIGLFLTSSVLSLLQPDVVVQIESLHKSKNFPVDLTPANAKGELEAKGRAHEGIKDYKLVILDSAANNNHGNVGWELEARQVREMCILTYMSRILPPGCKFLTEKSVPIYQCSLNDINILYNDQPCDPSVANANIVALCAENRKLCLGWGIVRGICTQNNALLLLTPLSVAQLDEVRNIIVGSVTLPPEIYLRQHEAIRGLVPYTLEGKPSTYAKAPMKAVANKQNDRT